MTVITSSRDAGADWARIRAGWGARVRAHREKAGLTQQELATAAGSTQPHICRLEKGGTGISDELRFAIAHTLGVNVEELFPYPVRRGRVRTRIR
jgi:putative transcriptional regulator